MDENERQRDARWGSYPETVLVFAGDPEVFLDLREPVPPATRKALAVIGLGEPFGILTAFNPRGQTLPDDENARRAEALESELRGAGDGFVRVDACSPDRSHRECSVALRGSRGRAIDLARRWEQIGIFWWDGSRFSIEGAISDDDPMILPRGAEAGARTGAEES